MNEEINKNDNEPKRNLFKKLFRLEWMLRRYHVQRFREMGPMAAPHRGQGKILALLKMKPEMSQKELSSILDIRSQSLGELLAKLERRGLIERTPSEEDRRSMINRLTEEGKKAVDQQDDEENSDSIFACLSEEEQTAFADYIERLTGNLEQQLGDDLDTNFPHGHGFKRGGMGHRFRGKPRHLMFQHKGHQGSHCSDNDYWED